MPTHNAFLIDLRTMSATLCLKQNILRVVAGIACTKIVSRPIGPQTTFDDSRPSRMVRAWALSAWALSHYEYIYIYMRAASLCRDNVYWQSC